MIHHEHEQNTDEWFRCRLGLPTASGASNFITPTGKASVSYKRYARELAADIIADTFVDEFGGNKWTERGHDLEGETFSWYEFFTDRETVSCGFFTDDEGRYGASPDRLVGDDGLVEMKNFNANNHLELIYEYRLNGTVPGEHRPQAAMQMLVTDRAWCDLVLNHPDLPNAIIRIERDAEYEKLLEDQIAKCIEYRDSVIKLLEKDAA